MKRETLMAQTFVELADTLVDEFDVVELFNRLTTRCVQVLDVAGAAGLMLLAPDGALRVMSSSNEAMRVLELFELQAQEGPCLDCYNTGLPVVNQDLTTSNGRWPKFTAEAINAGFKSVHAFPMRLRRSCLGALNLFHVDAGVLSPDDEITAQAFADVATIAILQHEAVAEAQKLNQKLSRALTSRAVIEQAKGVMAEREGLSMTEAFTALRRYSTANDIVLADVCGAVIDRSLPTWTLLDTFQGGQDPSA